MIRFAALILLVAFSPAARAEDKPTVDLFASVADEKLKEATPANGVVSTQKEWESLAKAWNIEKAPKVDFTKELLVVGTWRGSQFKLVPKVSDAGDLTIQAAGTKDLRPGFRYRIVSVDRSKIKTVNGKPLKE
ncbi:MAG: hypothetical protein U0791_13225 [Gemmataceae bacterium]